MGGKCDVYIIEVAGDYRVRPAVAMIDGATRKLNIRNLTGHTAFLVFPRNFLINNQEVISVTGNIPVPANLAQGLDGHYTYSVVISKNGVLVAAQGESAPSVIVDP